MQRSTRLAPNGASIPIEKTASQLVSALSAIWKKSHGTYVHVATRKLVEAFDLDLPGPLVATGFADQARRARGRTPRVFRQDMDVLSKNPANPVNPAHSAGRNRRGVLSLGHSFFTQVKKGGSLAAASETRERLEILDDHRCRKTKRTDGETTRFAVESDSLCGFRPTSRRKGVPRVETESNW